ncbi:MAG: (d)CMP kinase [Anaerolineales bacterium]|uniref:Cytidylate kinase n=1 Tax=Candidatus Desulfolinea nitratireducens TaxID=2841698 RepID=A0A8J6NMH7_9CHLR|nr:(d)CMP kinase [Candidatus Desulfolinea nitratireducens]MBL6960135.1 (d)CMP kinase [Anaerolineales bacterium]
MKQSPPKIIALDGPAASGKSTVGSRVADALDYLFFDTGVMYRAVTWMALVRKIDIHDENAVTTLTEDTPIDVRSTSQVDGRACDVLVENEDITWQIRRPEVDANVSVVSAYPGVRAALTVQQRRIGKRGKVVMVGRDIGTVVLPEADLKIYLDASAEKRARRRYDEIIARGEKADYAEILQKVIQRDHIDTTRDIAPLKPAEDAIILNSDQLNEDQVFEKIMALCA